MRQQIGSFSSHIINILGLEIEAGTPRIIK